MDETKKPVVVKKYANRRLYNTETSTYVTLDDLAAMVRAERDFVVYDAKSNEDLTHGVLTQIILEQESRGGENLLPVNFLRQLIRFYGDSVGRLVPYYLDMSIGMLAREQEKFRQQMTDAFGGRGFPPFGAGALDAMQEQSRKNMMLFEQTIRSFWAPFKGDGDTPQTGTGAGAASGPTAATPTPAAPVPASAKTTASSGNSAGAISANRATDAELAVMREQLAALQKQLDRLSQPRT